MRRGVAVGVSVSPDVIKLATPAGALPALRIGSFVAWPAETYGSALSAIFGALAPLLESESSIKVFHNLHGAARSMRTNAGVTLRGCLDLQLAMELRRGRHDAGVGEMLESLGVAAPTSGRGKDDPVLLLKAYDALALGDATMRTLRAASDARASMYATVEAGPSRRMAMDAAHGFRLMSRELLAATAPGSIAPEMPLQLSQSMEAILRILPPDLRDAIERIGDSTPVFDICLDVQRRPTVWRLAPPSIRVHIEAPSGALGCRVTLRVSGDRTVPYWSLRWPVTWRAAGVEVELVEVERGDHRDIISHPALLRAILEHVSVVPAVSEEPGE